MKKNDNMPLNYTEKNNSRISFLVSVVVLVVLCIAFNQIDYVMIRRPAMQAKKQIDSQKQKEEQVVAVEPVTTSVTIAAVGDNLVQPSLLRSGQYDTGEWNYEHVFEHIRSEIQSADLSIVNQETPFTSNHDLVSGSAPYATPVEMGTALVNAGFDVVTSATDFIDDNGLSFLSDTFSFWAENPSVTLLGIHESADTAASISTVTLNDITIAFLDYTFPSASSEESGEGSENSPYVIDKFQTQDVSAAIAKARASADCVIFSANWGKIEEPMPTEYEKEWANFLMQQGVDVVIGTHPNVLQPYGYLSDDAGHNMLIYYSLGAFVSGHETLKQLLSGLAEFTIQKTVTGDDVSVKIQNATLKPLVMHYSYDQGEYSPYLLSDYTDELASQHSVRDIIGDDFSVENLNTKYDEIMSMNVTPSTKTDLLDVKFDSSGNMIDANGNYIEDTDSITSGQYYSNLSSSEN